MSLIFRSRHRPEREPVGEAKARRAGSEAQRQSEHGGRGEGGAVAQRSQRVAEIREQRFHGTPNPVRTTSGQASATKLASKGVLLLPHHQSGAFVLAAPSRRR